MYIYRAGFACLAAGLVKREVVFCDQAAGHNITMLFVAILGISLPTMMTSIGQFEVHGATDLAMSHFISIVLLLLYGFYLLFTMTEPPPPAKEKAKLLDHEQGADHDHDDDDDDDDEEPILSLSAALAWLVLATIILAFLSELLSASVEAASEQLGLNKVATHPKHTHTPTTPPPPPPLPLRRAAPYVYRTMLLWKQPAVTIGFVV